MRRRHIITHGRVWLLLAVLLPGLLFAALLSRQDGPAEGPVRLSP